MQLTRYIVAMFSICVIVFEAGAVFGQSTSTSSGRDYPNKTIRIVTAETGGGVDFISRLIAQGLSGPLGQQVIVENRAGASTPQEIVAKAQPDGYTLLTYSSQVWILPLLQKVGYDAVKDFALISLMDQQPNILVVHPTVPVNSVKELIALAKAKPGVLNYSSPPAGSSPYMAGELFKSMAGLNIVRIGYKGAGPALNGLLGGEVQFMFPPGSIGITHVKSGRLKALAITSAQPSMLLPGLPTVAAAGVPGYESVSTHGLFAPARTPEAITKRLNQELVKLLNTADTKERFLAVGIEVIGSSPEQFRAAMNAETASMRKLIKDVGIRSD